MFGILLIINKLYENHYCGLLLCDGWGGKENVVINDFVEYLKHTDVGLSDPIFNFRINKF
jgi:hypothetical protein